MSIQTLNITETISTTVDFISNDELIDAQNLAKSRVYYFKSLGWLQFTNDELIAEAYAGITESILRFNPDKGSVKNTKFTSYAYFWIDKKIKEYIARNKSLLSGNLSECWRGDVPYTTSIDSYGEKDDSAGIDHLGFIADESETIDVVLIRKERQQKCKDLFSKLMENLAPMESLCYQLINGIGTISGKPMTIREIAESIEVSVGTVHSYISSANHKISINSNSYRVEYMEMCE
jgi:RNA polymerase sigma factor (sigma-70 family)